MESFKKILRHSGLVFLIVLASIGIGFGGGVPVTSSNKKEDIFEVKVELLDSNKYKTKLGRFKILQ